MIKAINKKLMLVSACCMLTSALVAIPVKIKGSVKNISSPYLYVYSLFGTEVSKLDSVKHTNGQYQFKFKDLPRGFYRIGESEQKSLMLILGEDNVTINMDLNNPSSVVVQNSRENALYDEFKKFNDKHNQELGRLNQKGQVITAQQQTNPEKYNKEALLLQKSFDSLNAVQKNYYTSLFTNNSDLVVTKYIKMFDFPENVASENFFSAADFSDVELTRGDMLPSKISYYFQKFVTPQIDQWKIAADEVLTKASEPNKNREVVYGSLIRMILPYDDQYAKILGKAYLAEFPQSVEAKRLVASLPKGAPIVGDMAPEINLSDPKGVKRSLSSLKGKIVLLDFWASWCGPCRGENPNVVRIYNKYKDKGFTVFSVSLDKSMEPWTQAIQNDNLSWPTHVSDLKGWGSSAAALYGVRGIPATFLIDKEGKIIAVNLRGESLEATLQGIFNE